MRPVFASLSVERRALQSLAVVKKALSARGWDWRMILLRKPARHASNHHTVSRLPNARFAQTSDFTSLLELYQFSEKAATWSPKEQAEQIWAEILSHEDVAVFVSSADAKIVATCMLITAPNLLRNRRQHGFLEMSSLILNSEAKPMEVQCCACRCSDQGPLSRPPSKWPRRPPVHRFYESCGCEPGLRIGYVGRFTQRI
jgi:hypothetical protein